MYAVHILVRGSWLSHVGGSHLYNAEKQGVGPNVYSERVLNMCTGGVLDLIRRGGSARIQGALDLKHTGEKLRHFEYRGKGLRHNAFRGRRLKHNAYRRGLDLMH